MKKKKRSGWNASGEWNSSEGWKIDVQMESGEEKEENGKILVCDFPH